MDRPERRNNLGLSRDKIQMESGFGEEERHPGCPDLRGLVEGRALLPRSHAARQGEEDAPVLDDQLRHEGDFDEHGCTGRQVADADGEHILRGRVKSAGMRRRA